MSARRLVGHSLRRQRVHVRYQGVVGLPEGGLGEDEQPGGFLSGR